MSGISFGINDGVGTTLISEIATIEKRAIVVILLNVGNILGQLYAIILAYLFLDGITEGNWSRYIFVSGILLICLGILIVLCIKESVRYLFVTEQY